MRSKLEGYPKSRLPEFSPDEIAFIKGTHDYMAINHYSSSMINATEEHPIGQPSIKNDISTLEWKKKEWPVANSDWFTVSIRRVVDSLVNIEYIIFQVVPWGLRKQLSWLKKTYGNPEIIITENGLADSNGTLADDHRIAYLRVSLTMFYYIFK